MADLIREAPFGQLIRFLSRNTCLKYPEDYADFEVPHQYIAQLTSEKPIRSGATHGSTPLNEDSEREIETTSLRATKTRTETAPYSNERFQVEQQCALQRTKTIPIVPTKTADGIVLVDWYTRDDSANPQILSRAKKTWVTFVMCFYTWVVYWSANNRAQ